jgi:hypothetical protein
MALTFPSFSSASISSLRLLSASSSSIVKPFGPSVLSSDLFPAFFPAFFPLPIPCPPPLSRKTCLNPPLLHPPTQTPRIPCPCSGKTQAEAEGHGGAHLWPGVETPSRRPGKDDKAARMVRRRKLLLPPCIKPIPFNPSSSGIFTLDETRY